MFSHDGKLFKVMELIGNYCFLNFLWIVSSIPIITIPASTSAMLGVIKDLSQENELTVAKAFYGNFKKNFKRSSIVGIIQLLIGIVLIGDLFIMWNLEGSIRYLMLSLFGIFTLIYLFMSIYIYPLIVETDLSLRKLISNSFYLTITRPATPTIILLFICINVFICTFVQFLPLLCAFSITSFISYYICNRTMAKID